MSRAKNLGGLVLVLAFTVLLYSLLPLGRAFQFGDDEGFEVIKPFMCLKGYSLYKDIWNDQPPVFTLALTAAFKAFEPTILTARLVAAAYGLILIAAFHEMVRMRSGPRTALIATLLLLAAPSVLLLSVSAMLEAPAFATGLLSAFLLFHWGRSGGWPWLIASGVVMGVAMQTKLTAALIVPAILIEVLLISRKRRVTKVPEPKDRRERAREDSGEALGSDRLPWFRRAALGGLLWSASLAVAFAVIGLVWARGAFESSWRSHTKTQVVPGLDRPQDHKFDYRLIKGHLESAIAALVTAALVARQRRLREVAFPLTLLLTVLFVHSIHRPWWNYYYIHFAVPIAWLSGWLANEILGRILSLSGKTGFNLARAATWQMLVLCVGLAILAARAEQRLETTLKDLRHRPAILDNPIVLKMREWRATAKWAYCESGIYAFQAQVPVIPDLAVIMPKRFWSGQITRGEIIETCRRYEPDFIVLPSVRSSQWDELLSNYFVEAGDGKNVLYMKRRIAKRA